jgi:hypothetical protein
MIFHFILWLIVLHRFGKTGGNRFGQVSLFDAIVCCFQQPDLILTQGQDIEALIAQKERQEWFQVEVITDKHLLLKTGRELVVMKGIWRAQDC